MHPLSPKPNLPKNAHYHLNTGGIDEPNGIHQDISPFYLIQWYTTRWPTIWKVESLIELKRVNDFYYRPFQTRLRKDLHIYLWTGCVWRKYWVWAPIWGAQRQAPPLMGYSQVNPMWSLSQYSDIDLAEGAMSTNITTRVLRLLSLYHLGIQPLYWRLQL